MKKKEQQGILTLLTKCVAEHYHSDPSGAGVVVAFVRPKGLFYCSVCRYKGAFGGDKEVVARGWGENTQEAVLNAAKDWRGVSPEHLALDAYLRGVK